jgi:single-stranded-DNA-specific exonuclease
VLVTDHHLPGETLPAAEAIVNPNLRDCDFPSKSLAGVGVAFYLMLALRTFLRDKGWFEARGIARRTWPSCWIWWRLAPWRTSCRWMPTTVF